ncbi:MAG: glycosyltransferase family 39 protein [Patescibacteria group bacterium]|nr:glycosyltransferase family 39 protein [Patescibacteria group bacterium]
MFKVTAFLKASLIFLLFLAFFYRIYGLTGNYSFWTDEASTARFGRAVSESGLPLIKLNNFSLKVYLATHYLTGFSFKVLGQNELAARLPEVIFGTLVVLLVFIMGKKLFQPEVGLAAAALTAFSYAQIAWSRQARGYTIFEFFFLLTLLGLYLYLEFQRGRFLILFFGSLFFSILTHTLGLTLLPIAMLSLLMKPNTRKIAIKLTIFLVILGIVLAVFLQNALVPHLRTILPRLLHGGNFISYYHSLFWRQYPIFVFLSLLAIFNLWKQKKNDVLTLFLSSLVIYLFSASFLLHVPFEKYVLVLFPLLFLLTSESIFGIAGNLAEGFKKNKIVFFNLLFKKEVLFFLLIGFIIGSGNKFSLKPRQFYSLNFDMREIPEINYKGIYEMVAQKAKGKDWSKIAVVDIDEDIPSYYLGEGKISFIPRNDMVDLKVSQSTGAVFLHSLVDFEEVYKKYPLGFLILVEHNFRFYQIPTNDFARKNLFLEKKEEYASFSPDWNRWPVEVYSWGFDKTM